ncbi:MAG TPA: 50S ribosomal protein L18 [Candidatus Binatia bacterium]|nr:50S ribosomal protein L18 [Candidatus Binatia bacterium]
MVGNEKRIARQRRQARVRRRLLGSDQRPRLSVYRSNKHMYAQVISDETGRTLAAASTLSPELREGLKNAATRDAAKQVGALIAKLCAERAIREVVFDRNGFLYHGRVKVLADAAREAGLKF